MVLQSLLDSHHKSMEIEQKDRLLKVHSDAMIRAKAGIDVYAALVSSMRSYIKNSPEFPSELQMQSFLKDLIKDLEFNDSIVVSYLDINHEFKYVFSPKKIDEAKLKGKKAIDFRPKEEIEKLNALMLKDEITMFKPINLQEGWAGFPFNFGVQDNNGNSLGYLAPIINVKYLLDYFYSSEYDDFVHFFKINNEFDISREVVYDGTKIYNTKKDDQYYKTFKVEPDQYVSSNLDVFGLNLKVGSAYKVQPIAESYLALVVYLWYAGLILFTLLTLIQFFRNNRLNKKLKIANLDIEEKNQQLEKKINHVQTLIKEIHHRLKNNMMMITGLIDLQSQEYEDKKVIKALEQSKNRIQSMSLIHEKLYGSDTLEDINAREYTKQLIDFIEQTVKDKNIEIKKEFNIPHKLNFDGETMVPLGLILNELITNSYKYAFATDRNNLLKIDFNETSDGYLMTYSDNGPGIPETFDIKNTTSLGMQLVHILSDELHGNVIYSNNGLSTFEINFKQKFHEN